MIAYEPSVLQDLKMYSWYEQLVLSKDIQLVLGANPARYSLSVFMANFQDPVVLLHEDDEKGWWFCMWAKPSYVGAADVHLWARKEKRHTKAVVRAVSLGLTALLQQFTMLFGITTEEGLVQEYERFGFVRCGVLPPIGETTTPIILTYLTREAFDAAAVPLREAASG